MRIAFVQDIIQFVVPLGTATVAGSLRKGGHDVDIFNKTIIEFTI